MAATLAQPASISESVRAAPCPALRGLIAAYDGYRQRGIPPARQRGLPSPFLTLIVTLHEPLHVTRHVQASRPPAVYAELLGGLHATPVQLAHDGAQSGIQLRISPLAARPLLGLPAGAIAGEDLDAGDVLGQLAGELHQRLLEAPGWLERFAVLDRALARRLGSSRPSSPPRPLVQAWRLLLSSAGRARIEAVAREVGWSERQLEKSFRREIGLSPKLAARVIRFHRARHLLQGRVHAGEPADAAGAAAICGYSDQSHLVRDFRAFTGLAPGRWLAEEFANVQDRAPHGDLLSLP